MQTKEIKNFLLLVNMMVFISCGSVKTSDCACDTTSSGEVVGAARDIVVDNSINTESQLTTEGSSSLGEIKRLIDDSTSGRKKGVRYITIGDSTRDSFHAEQYYWYKKRLAGFNIAYYHEAQSGMRAEDWVRNKLEGDKSLASAVSKTASVDGKNTIIEYSLGINDSNKPNSTEKDWKKHIKFGITEFQRLRPKALIFLVVPVTTLAKENGIKLTKIYSEISKELKLPLLNQKRVLKVKFENPATRVKYYYDNTHPNYFGAIRLWDYIVYNITGTETRKVIQWNPHIYANTSAILGNLAEGKKVNKAFWQTTVGKSIPSESFRSLEELNVVGNTLLRIKHGGNKFSTIVRDKDGRVVGRFDTEKRRFVTDLEAKTSFVYKYLYLPEEACKIDININISTPTKPYIATDPVIVEYIVDDFSKAMNLAEIHSGLSIEKVGNKATEK